LFSGNSCTEDESPYCTVPAMMAQYCGYAAYRKICCQSCSRFLNSQQGRGIGQNVFERPEAIAIFSTKELNMTGLYQRSIGNQVNDFDA